jgi:hypothetical protein
LQFLVATLAQVAQVVLLLGEILHSHCLVALHESKGIVRAEGIHFILLR